MHWLKVNKGVRKDHKRIIWKCFSQTPLACNEEEVFSREPKSIPGLILGTDRTNVCWVKEGCSSLKPSACSTLPLEVVDHVDKFDAEKLNLHLNTGCYTSGKVDSLLNNAPASCNPPCFRITKPGEYCYMGTRNNNFSNRRHVGKITVTGRSLVKRKFFPFPKFSKEE